MELQDPRYYTDILTERAVEFVRRDARASPWLLNLNFTSPHWPWEGPGDKAVSDEITDRIKAGDRKALFHDDGGSLENTSQMVENLDAAIGKVLGALNRTGQEEDTVVLFASDNGGERFSYSWPFTGNKASVNEGGIRVPTILRGRAGPRPPGRATCRCYTTDWTATFLELGGAKPDPAYPLDGTSLVGYLCEGAARPSARPLLAHPRWPARCAAAT